MSLITPFSNNPFYDQQYSLHTSGIANPEHRALIERYPSALEFYNRANAICDLNELPIHTLKLALNYQKTFLLLIKKDALPQFLSLPSNLQGRVLASNYHAEDFLFIIQKDALPQFLSLPSNLQESVLFSYNYPKRFVLIIQKNALSEFLSLPSYLQERVLSSYTYTDGFLLIKEKNALSEFLKQPYERQKALLEHPELFITLIKANALDFLDSYPIDRLGLTCDHIPSEACSLEGIMNTPTWEGVTVLHRAARNGNLEHIDRVINELPEDSVVLNPKVYFSSKTLASCRAPSAISQLDQIPIDDFAFPLIIAQNYCNTHIKMKDGSILILEHTDAKQVYDLLTIRSKTEGVFQFLIYEMRGWIGNDTPPALANNKLSIYINPGHGFSRLDCLSCQEDGGSFNRPIGFYGRFGDDILGLEHSENNQFLKISFPINDEQAKALWERQNALRKGSLPTDFKPFSNNCIDYTTKVFQALGEAHPYGFFTEEQLAYTPYPKNRAIQYARLKYKYNFPTDTLFSAGSLISLYTIYQACKLTDKIEKACFSSACNLTRKVFNRKTPTLQSEPSTPPPEQKTPTFVKIGLSNIASHALRYMVRTITGHDNPILATATNYSLLANAVLCNEVLSADTLNPVKEPSLWNKKISLYVAAGLASTAASLSMEIAKNFMDESTPEETLPITICLIYGLFFSLVGVNEMRKLYHSVTAPPIIDGLSLE